ncbi:MAG TPA: BTAD domain-containing putative transcriptional regulator [Candidatus Dormibacteraeota bacterium]
MKFKVLGPMEVRRGDQALSLGGAKQRALLAILLIEANHVVGLERLAELLWRDEPPPTSDHIIEVYVSQLRRALEPAGAPYNVLVRKPSGYMLQVARDAVDAAEFQDLVEAAKSAAPEEADAQLTRALSMWRGPALADFAGEPFAVSEAARLNELRLHAREERIEAELALGRHGRLIGELQALVDEHPLRERLCGQLMLALYRSGRQAEASDVYQRTRQRLVDELGMEPGPELQLLLKRILQQDSGLAAAAGGPATPILPSGTVSFLLTDVEGSTRRWDRNPAAMRLAMETHDAVLGRLVTEHGGMQVESGREGDSILATFARASDAVACGVAMQRELSAHAWPEGADLHIRVAINSGEAELRSGHYYGPAVYRCARLLAIGHGDQVLLTQATRDLVIDTLPDGVGLRELGSHGLRNLERPEVVFQIAAPGLRAEFPPLKSTDARRHNLPVSPNGFVGRSGELAEIKERLATNRMLTLIGAGGTGKTRLALQAAAKLIEGFKDGVWLVELASISQPELVVQAAAEALGVREEAGRPIVKTLCDWLRDKSLLLLLDNCEHLVPAVVSLADQVLRECPDVRLLATSRAALRINGEAITKVGPLTESDAVVLFADRSNAVQPAFRLTEENSESVVQICRRVEGIPLAIELAAGRARMMAPAEILTRLQDSFDVLAGGSRSADARHETLRSAMDWSYRLLNEEEQRFFMRLSVFAGGFSLEAAEAVCAYDGLDRNAVMQLLGRLVEQSLVNVNIWGQGPARTRYGLLETLREYGRAKLEESPEADVIRRRHAAHFVALAEAAGPKLDERDRLEWLERLDLDRDNLRAVFERSAGTEADIDLRLAVALTGFWDARGGYSEGRARLTLALSRGGKPSRLRAEAMRDAGIMAWAQGDFAAATSWCEESLKLSRRLRDRRGEGMCLQHLGQIAFHRERFSRARAYLDSALAIAEEIRDERLASLCRFRLGMIAIHDDDRKASSRLLQASLESGRQAGYEEMVVMSLWALGHFAIREGRLEEADALLSEGLETWRDRGGPRQIASLLEAFAVLAAARGDALRAMRLTGAAESLRKEIGAAPAQTFQRDLMERLRPARESLRDEAMAAAGLGAPMGREEAIAYALGEASGGSSGDR